MSSPSRKKTRTTSAGDAMKLVAKPEPALTYAARDSFAFQEEPAAQDEPAPVERAPKPMQAAPAPKKIPNPPLLPALVKPAIDPAGLLGKRLGEVGSANVEAVARASAILARGLEEMGQSVLALGQRNLESSLNLAKAAIGTTTLRQLVDLQTGYARDSFDRLVAEGSKLQEISLKTADAALQPLKARMAATIESFGAKAA